MMWNRRQAEQGDRWAAECSEVRRSWNLFLPASVCASALISVSAWGAGPRIQFASTNLDFGKLEAGQALQHQFTFTNTSDQPLEIQDVRPSCGCTMAGSWDRLTLPGKSSAIPIRFDSTDSYGEVSKTVIVLCNDPARTNVVLRLAGVVWRPLDITPPLALFAPSSDCQTNQTCMVRIVNHRDQPLTLSAPECASPAFRATLRTVRPGLEFELLVMLPAGLGSNNASGPIVLKTSWPERPTITIPAHAVPKPAVVVVPPQLTLPPRPLSAGAVLGVTIRNNGAAPLALSEPSVDAPGVELRLRELQRGRSFLLEASFPPGFHMDAGQAFELRLKTNHPQFPLLKVPVLRGQSLATASLAGPPDPQDPQGDTALASRHALDPK